MVKEQSIVGLGLMSGSSLDGVDLAICSFKCQYNQKLGEVISIKLDLIEHTCVTFPDRIKQGLVIADQLKVSEFTELDKDLGVFFGKAVSEFLETKPKHGVEFVASHGHTILHEPSKSYSCQIGSLAHIAANSGLVTIGDFRNMDMAYGGEGAPMAPLIDHYIYPDVDMFLNVGGIANISYKCGDTTLGYDLAPANQFYNLLAAELGYSFDDGGRLASKGFVNENLLNELEGLAYFSKRAPKSLDNIDIRENIWPIVASSSISIEDKLATCVQLLVRQFEKSMDHYLSFHSDKQEINLLISGGGAKNTFLVDQLLNLADQNIRIDHYKIPNEVADMKEAMLMVLAGGLRILGLPNVFSSVTGATKDSIGGGIYYP